MNTQKCSYTESNSRLQRLYNWITVLSDYLSGQAPTKGEQVLKTWGAGATVLDYLYLSVCSPNQQSPAVQFDLIQHEDSVCSPGMTTNTNNRG